MPQPTVSNRPAITLVELIVVLVVLGLGAALVAPALIFPEESGFDGYAAVLDGAVELAAAREEVLSLVVGADGRWRLGATAVPEALADGRIAGYDGPAFALLVSPLGSCGPPAGAPPPFELDPLTCAPTGARAGAGIGDVR